MPSLHVIPRQDELDPSRLHDKVVVVLDVLFATSTIVHALAQGASSILPTGNAADARTHGGCMPGALLAGEYRMESLPDFAPASPLTLARLGLRGRDVVYSTTNGTPAFVRARRAAHVYAAALLNGRAVVDHVARSHPDASVLLVCAGSNGRFNVEDFYGAGHLVTHFHRLGGYAPTDAALAAGLLRRSNAARDVLFASRVGRCLQAMHLDEEIEYAANCDTLDAVPHLRDDRLVRAA